MRPLSVVNPYATQLTFLDSRLRTRRDHAKYLSLIRSIALLHQYQRPIKEIRVDGKIIEYIEVIPKDIEVANRLVHKVMGTSLDDLAPQTRRLLDLLWKMAEEQDKEEYQFTRKDVREYTGWGDTQLKVHLQRLVDMEYLVLCRGIHSQRYIYELLYKGEGKEGNPFVMGLLNPNQLSKGI